MPSAGAVEAGVGRDGAHDKVPTIQVSEWSTEDQRCQVASWLFPKSTSNSELDAKADHTHTAVITFESLRPYRSVIRDSTTYEGSTSTVHGADYKCRRNSRHTYLDKHRRQVRQVGLEERFPRHNFVRSKSGHGAAELRNLRLKSLYRQGRRGGRGRGSGAGRMVLWRG